MHIDLIRQLFVTHVDLGYSYISRLEQRLQDIESSIQQMQGGQNVGHTTSSNPSALGRDNDTPASELLSGGEEHQSVLLPSTVGGHEAAEVGEVDISENSIDGMGAMKFTNEEDCGFFGMP